MPDQPIGFFETLALHPALFIGCCVVLGLLVGSFLNVVIYRVPIMMDNELRADCAALAAAEAPPADSQTSSDAPDSLEATESAVAPPTSGTSSAAEGALEPPVSEVAAEEPVAAAPAFNLLVPRSACPSCHTLIRAQENIPVLSWLMLGGKCSSCGAAISKRYPLVELTTGILSGFVAWQLGFGMTTVAALVFTWFLIALTMIDFDTQFLPDQLTYPLLWLGLLVSLTNPVWAPSAEALTPRDSIIGAASGYLSLWGVYWAFRGLTGKEGMGYGDFKLFAALGAWMGWQMLLPIIVFASGVGAVFGIVVMIRQHKGRDTQIAFGPFLAIAGWLALMFGHRLVSGYLAQFNAPG